MAFDKTTLGLYHTFSKTPVDQNSGSAAAQLGNAINKSGHTVQSSEVWAEAIPFYGKAGKTELAHKNLSATANTNDLVQVGSVLYQRNSTPAQFDASGALTSTFEDLWFEKTTSIISTTKGEDGTYPTVDGALVDGSYLVNAEGKPVIRYYKDRLLTPLIDDNNANTHSQGWASRLKVDGRWVEQFVGATDAYVNGNAAVMYSPVIYRKKGDPKPLDAGAGKHYMDYCATGLILWDSQKTSITTNSAGEFTGATEVISCFEYVGKKLNASLASLATDIEAINIQLGNSGGSTTGGIGERLTTVEGEVTTLKTTTIPNAITTANSYTDSAISDATLTSADNAIQSATGDTANKLVTAAQVKEYVDENAKVTLTADTAEGKTGITISPNGQEATSFTIGIDQTKIATKKSVDDLAGLVSGLPTTIQAAQDAADAAQASAQDAADAADAAMGEAQAKVASVTLGSTIPTGVSLGDDTKNPVLTIETYNLGDQASEFSNLLITASAAHTLATHYADLAEGAAVDTVKAISLTSSTTGSTSGSYVSVTTTGTVGDGISVHVDDSALASTVSAASTAVQSVTVNGTEAKSGTTVSITALTAVDTSATGANGITIGETNKKVTLSVTPATYTSASKSWSNDTNFAKASDIATAIADAVNGITIPSVTTSTAAQTVGVTASGHEVSVATAEYAASTDSWTNKPYLVTGATVEAFVNDVVSEVSSDLTALENKVNAYHEAGVSYKVHDSQTLPDLSIPANVENYKNVILLVPTS